jgi:hypothetical protein
MYSMNVQDIYGTLNDLFIEILLLHLRCVLLLCVIEFCSSDLDLIFSFLLERVSQFSNCKQSQKDATTS